jgi:hypothetical protein
MIAVHASGTWDVIGRKTGAILVRKLTIDKQYEVDAPFEHPVLPRVLAECSLRGLLVDEFVSMLRADRALYLRIGGTQWCVEPSGIEYDFQC